MPLQCKAQGNGTQCAVAGKITVPMGNLSTSLNSLLESWDARPY